MGGQEFSSRASARNGAATTETVSARTRRMNLASPQSVEHWEASGHMGGPGPVTNLLPGFSTSYMAHS